MENYIGEAYNEMNPDCEEELLTSGRGSDEEEEE